jgi:MFS family permease
VTLPRSLVPFGHRNFSLYWVGFAASNAGRWIELTGAVWIVYELTNSPALLGLLGITRAAPAILLSAVAGVVADRTNQRKLLFTTQLMSLGASLTLGLLIASGGVELWHVYLQVIIQSTISAFDAATRQALFPRLVPRTHIAEAVTLSITAGRVSKLIGPAVGGIAIANLGEASPFLFNAATFLALMAAVAWMRGVDARTAPSGASFRTDLGEGLRHIWRAPVLSGLLKMEIVMSVFGMNPILIAVVGREVLGVGPEGLGGLLSAPAAGSFFGIAWLLMAGQRSRQGRFGIAGTLVYAATLIGVAISTNYVLTFLAFAILGLLDALITINRNSVMQLAAPPHMRGRVMANLGIVTRGIGPLGETQSGIVAGAIGAPLAVVSGAIALAVGAVLTARRNPALWGFSLDTATVAPELNPRDPPLEATDV